MGSALVSESAPLVLLGLLLPVFSVLFACNAPEADSLFSGNVGWLADAELGMGAAGIKEVVGGAFT